MTSPALCEISCPMLFVRRFDRMRLIVLDDDMELGRLSGRVAGQLGYESTLTTEAAEFRAACLAEAPDLILLDLQLGDTDGIEQLRWLASQRCRAAILLISGFDTRVLATAEMMAKSLGLKIAGTLAKPFRVADLQASIRK